MPRPSLSLAIWLVTAAQVAVFVALVLTIAHVALRGALLASLSAPVML